MDGFAYDNSSNLSATLDYSSDDNFTSNLTCDYEKHQWLMEKFYINSVTAAIIAAFGIFGNATTAIILAQPKMRSANNCYLTALAIFDTILLLAAIMLYPCEYLIEYTDNANFYVVWTAYLPYAYTISNTAQTASVYTTIAVTIERYVATVHPHFMKSYACSNSGAILVVIGVALFALAFNAGRFWELHVGTKEECEGFGSRVVERGVLLLDDTYATVYGLWLSSIVMVFAPFLLLLLFNSIIVLSIHKARENGRRLSRDLREKTKNATIVLVVIVLIFLICNFWGFVTTLLEYVLGLETLFVHYGKFYSFSREVINLLAIVNSSINFMIYCIFGKDFRKEVVKIYGCMNFRFTIHMPDLMRDKFRADQFDMDDSGTFVHRLMSSMASLTPRLSVASVRRFYISNGDDDRSDQQLRRSAQFGTFPADGGSEYSIEMTSRRRHSTDNHLTVSTNSMARNSIQSTQKLLDSKRSSPGGEQLKASTTRDQPLSALCKVRLKQYGTNSEANKNGVNGFADARKSFSSSNSHVWL